ncbi:MAG: hypothetical protein H0X38_07955, partial [Planctomycetes bacterium]|nr:hypothetical protein [Planctomycetota bacterium]
AALPAPVDVDALCRGGAPQWGSALEVAGTLGANTGAYTVDTVPLPIANPWKSWIRPTGVDFFRDGRAAIATFSGDVWIASGVDQTLAKVSWRRYAAGLYEPLGLRIVDDVAYVLGRDQITRLVDLDHDGEADAYESFNHDGVVWPTYNNFAFDLQTDQAGNFYYAKGALNTPVGLPLQSVLCRVGKDGRGTTVVATGLRQPNGLGMGPHDELTVSDNEGQWVPASKIVWVRPGGWYGYVGDPPHYKKDVPAHPAAQDPPLCWMPMAVDSSSGGEAWAPAGWGPLGGQLLHTSYGKSSLMLVLHEEVDGVMQGAVMTLPLKFASGIMRARCNAADGQLYVCGIRGWQTTGAADGCLQRVRATAKPACLPIAMHVTRSGVAVTFSAPLDASAADAGNIGVSCWNYLWSAAYGSAEYAVSDPKRKGRDHLDVTAATLSADQRTLTMAVTGVVPCMQMAVEMRVQAADGSAADATLYATVNAVGR